MASKTTKRPDSQKTKRQLLQEKEEERIKLKTMRKSAGEVWVDPNMGLWQDNDYRIFCGNLGNEVTDDVLTNSFKKYTSFSRARVVRDKRSQKTKGFGFVSFLDPQDFLKAFKEMQGKYIGNRPVKLSKSDWETRSFGAKKDDELGNNFLRKGIQKGKQQTLKH